MNPSLRTACILVATALASIPLGGCKVTVEPLTRYEGTPVSESIGYSLGKAVHIIGANGQIEVVRGNSDRVEVTFSPFTMDEDTAEDQAVNEMEDKLALTIIDSGEILIEVAKRDGSSGYLGADVKVALPATFNGGFEIDQGNGDIEADLSGGDPSSTDVENKGGGGIKVIGARGTLRVIGNAGDVEVSVAEWGVNDGVVEAGAGDISFSLPSDADGTITASAGGQNSEVTEHGVPTTWAMAGEGGAKSYTMGTGEGAQVDLTTDLGNIAIIAQ